MTSQKGTGGGAAVVGQVSGADGASSGYFSAAYLICPESQPSVEPQHVQHTQSNHSTRPLMTGRGESVLASVTGHSVLLSSSGTTTRKGSGDKQSNACSFKRTKTLNEVL